MNFDFDENEPPSVREERFAAERAQRRAVRKAASLDSRGAHVGAVVVTIALVLLGWYGKLAALGIVSGFFLLLFATARAWAYADGDHGRHALQRAYNVTFGWAVFPELAAYRGRTTRPHPRPGRPGRHDSHVGGPFLWPGDEPWPVSRELHEPETEGYRPDEIRAAGPRACGHGGARGPVPAAPATGWCPSWG